MASSRPSAPSRNSRRRLVVAVVALTFIIALVAPFLISALPGSAPTASKDGRTSAAQIPKEDRYGTGVVGDTNRDNTVDPDEKKALAASQKSLSQVEAQVAPADSTETLLTPAGADWWQLVTSVAGTGMWHAAPPAGATWYAYTRSPLGEANATDVVSVVFPTAADASDWVMGQAAGGGLGGVASMRRGRVVSLAPVFVDLVDGADTGLVPEADLDLDALDAMDVPVAIWSKNVGAAITAESRDATDPAAYRTFWTHLGFTPGSTRWTATASHPQGPWTGTLTGYHPDSVSVLDAAAALTTGGMGDALMEARLVGPDGSAGVPQLDRRLPVSDPDLVFTTTGGFRGAITGAYTRTTAPWDAATWWVKGDTLTIEMFATSNDPFSTFSTPTEAPTELL